MYEGSATKPLLPYAALVPRIAIRTIASKIAASYQGAASGLESASLLYLAAILLFIGLLTNLVAQVIVRRFDPLRGAS